MINRWDMNRMRKAQRVMAVWNLVSSPIWFWLLWLTLRSVHASKLMWVLYWLTVVTSFASGILLGVLAPAVRLVDNDDD